MERRTELKALRRWAAAAIIAVAGFVPSMGLAQQDEQWDDRGDDRRFHEDGSAQWGGGQQWDGGDQRFGDDRGGRSHRQRQHRDGSAMPVPQSGGTRPYWGTTQPYWGTTQPYWGATQPYWGPSGAPTQQLPGNTPLNRRGR